MIKRVAAWPMWKLPRVAIALLIVVDVSALIAPWTVAGPVTRSALATSTLLASLSIAYSAVSVRAERARRALHKVGSPSVYLNVLAIWTFAAAVMLPISLAAIVIIIAVAAEWPARSASGKAALHKYVYSSAGILLAGTSANAICQSALPRPLALAAAVVAYVGVSYLLVGLIMAASAPLSNLKIFLAPRTYYVEVVTISIALVESVMGTAHVPLIWLSLPAAMLVQRQATKSALRQASGIVSRPMSEKVWSTVAREVVRACATASVLRIDTDDPIAARAVAQMQAGCDAIGTVGRSGLAILLADCPGNNADSLALRLRSALITSGVTASVAVAAKPRDGQSLADLLAVSEAELITRDAASRHARAPRPEV